MIFILPGKRKQIKISLRYITQVAMLTWCVLNLVLRITQTQLANNPNSGCGGGRTKISLPFLAV